MIDLDPNILVQIFLVGASIATAIIILIRTGQSNKITKDAVDESKKANELLRMELYAKFTPVIRIMNPTVKKEDSFPDFNRTFYGLIYNEGEVPIKSIRLSYSTATEYSWIVPFSIVLTEKNSKIHGTDITSTISPKTKINFSLGFRIDDEPQEYYFAIWLEYRFLDKNETMIQTFKITPQNVQLVEIHDNEAIDRYRRSS